MRDSRSSGHAGRGLTEADRAVLAETFAALEPLAPGLAERLVRYVAEGEDAEALAVLAALNGKACEALRLRTYEISRGKYTEGQGEWRRWFTDASKRDAALLLRLAKVITAPPPYPITIPRTQMLRCLNPPDWLEPFLLEFATHSNRPFGNLSFEGPVRAELIEDLLDADESSRDLIYQVAFPRAQFSNETVPLSLLGGLKDYGANVARRPELVLEALGRPKPAEKVYALRMFKTHEIPPADFAEPLAALAVSSAKTVREAAAPLLLEAGPAALPPLGARAESGSTDERLHAVQLIGRLESPEARSFLRDRAGEEKAAKVKAALAELAARNEHDSSEGTTAELPPIDVFEGVALTDELQAGIVNVVAVANRNIEAGTVARTEMYGMPLKSVEADALRRAFALLEQPSPWEIEPELLLFPLRWAAPEEFNDVLKQPGLTPLHAVRLLRLTGDLRCVQQEGHLSYFDFESPLRIYRDAHEPPLDLRTLGAAFRASALDDLAIARIRFQLPGFRRFDWPDEAVWPYFAEHLDWLESAFTPSGERFGSEFGLFNQAQRRQEVFEILAKFPAPPPRFVDRLWACALGSSKTERPLAQRCLERQPDRDAKLLAALAKGKQEARIAAAEFVARLRLSGAVEALTAALARERVDAVRNALMNALEQLGAQPHPMSTSTETRAGDNLREELAAEAKKGLKGGIPKGIDWFPFDRLPEVRWSGDDVAISSQELTWLVVQAWKSKSPEPTAMLRQRIARLREDDAQALGQFVLDAWLAREHQPPPPEVVEERSRIWDGMYGQFAGNPVHQALYNELLASRESFIHAPGVNALGDKGLFAIVAACAPPAAAKRVRAYLDQWYGNRVHQCRALVRMLAWTEHPEAVAVLLAVAKRFRTKSIRQEAEEQARKLAERKGVSLAELADQALPDLGLGDDGRLVLDYGPRRFFARLDDDGDVILDDESGQRISALPSPRQADDAAKVKEAKAALSDLKSRAKAARKTLAERLYEAMCTQRAWRFADWRETILAHPVAGRLCRRLVWVATDVPKTFRPLEDGSLTDMDDGEVRLEPNTTVRLAHTLTVSADDARRWPVQLADYEVSPLFPQFPPAPFRLADDQRDATSLKVEASASLKREALQRLTRGRGYDPLAFRMEDGGYRQVKHFPAAGLQAAIDLDLDDESEPVHALMLTFLPAGGSADRLSAGGVALGKVPPVLLSECHADLVAIAGAS